MAVIIDGSANTITARATTSLNTIGTGQTWQVVTGSRTAGIEYTNDTGKSIMISIQTQGGASLSVGGVVAATSGINNATNYIGAIVPNGAKYVLTGANQRWSELR